MELSNEFRVSVPVDQAWAVLTDLERIAPCMPGAELREVEGDEYRGVVKVKVGPITAQYKGKATFVDLDPVAHRAVLVAEGRDTRGQGNATATVRAELDADGDATAVRILTDLAVTGKVAQFGRGVLADVSAKLLDQFVARLEADVLSGSAPAPTPAAPPTARTTNGTSRPNGTAATTATVESIAGEPPETHRPASEPAPVEEARTRPADSVRTIQSPPAEPVDLLDAAGGSVAKRLIPAGLGLILLIILWRALRRG